jgi:hypothetical protein
MLQEFHLVPRTIYSFLMAFALTCAIGLGFSMAMLGIGILIFAISFLFQYYVLRFALKEVVTTPDGRYIFLLGWWAFCFGGIIGSGMMIPPLEDLGLYAIADEYLKKAVLWGSIFTTFSAAFVAMTCARRTFNVH